MGSGRKDTLRGVDILSSKRIIAVGDTGTILKSTDGGDTWAYDPFPGLNSNLNNVFFQGDFGTIVGDSTPSFGGPPIIFSGDSGINFSQWGAGQANLQNKSINSVWMPKGDPNKAVLVGEFGLILNTHDAGVTWNQPQSGTVVSIKDVAFFSDKDGFACGPDGVLLRTKNCGDTWAVVTTNPPISSDLITMGFPKDSTGFFGGGLGEIYNTTDGGLTFNEIGGGFRPNLTDITFLDDSFGIGPRHKVGVAVGEFGAILRTENGGGIWEEGQFVTTDPWETVTSALTPTGSQFWTAGGKFGSFGRISTSLDSGKTWKPQPIFSQKFFGITFRDSLNGTAVGLGGVIFCTKDGGKNWVQKTSGTNEWLLDVEMTNDSTAWVAGGFGTILKGTNFGNNWTPLTSGTSEWLTNISFLDDSFGIAVGNHGVILRTENAGLIWDNISVASVDFDYTGVSLAQGIRSSNRTTKKGSISITAVGYGGTIMFSPDGGDTWIKQESHTHYPLTGCYFSDSVNGTAVGMYGTILRTFRRDTTTVGIEDALWDERREESLLEVNFPNPFSVSTIIPFSVPYKAPVDLRIFDLNGRQVDQLINKELRPGSYQHEWKPKNLPPGNYVVRLQVGHISYSRKLVLNR